MFSMVMGEIIMLTIFALILAGFAFVVTRLLRRNKERTEAINNLANEVRAARINDKN